MVRFSEIQIFLDFLELFPGNLSYHLTAEKRPLVTREHPIVTRERPISIPQALRTAVVP